MCYFERGRRGFIERRTCQSKNWYSEDFYKDTRSRDLWRCLNNDVTKFKQFLEWPPNTCRLVENYKCTGIYICRYKCWDSAKIERYGKSAAGEKGFGYPPPPFNMHREKKLSTNPSVERCKNALVRKCFKKTFYRSPQWFYRSLTFPLNIFVKTLKQPYFLSMGT